VNSPPRPQVGRPRRDQPAGDGREPAIALEGLERRYGDRTALSGVTVTVPAGATLAVFGSNGAGKTTLLRVLASLLRPHAGSAHVLGSALPDEAWKVRGRVGYLGHESLLYRDLTVRQNLEFHARLHGVKHGVDEAIAAVGLERRARDPVRELSRGMVQRAAVARATLHDPAILLLDEPRANLDPAAAEQLESLIGKPSGRTRVIASHDVEHALAEADVALGLRAGEQVFAGNPDAATVRKLYA
jgi:heme exporter protein A